MSLKPVNLSKKQKYIVERDGGALLVEAGPGSGKTRVLTERIRHLLSTPKSHFRVLGLTFTNKAAIEMEDRLKDLGELSERLFTGTLHSFCHTVLQDRGKRIGVTTPIVIFEKFEDRKSVLEDAAAQDPLLSAHLFQSGSRDNENLLRRWLDIISFYKSNPSQIGRWKDAQDPRILEAYNGGLQASRAYDFDDILLLCYRLFTEHPKIADFYRRLYQHICIDEAQDLNEAQYSVIRALCGDRLTNVLMVGDPKQAIYSFSQASPKYMKQFAVDFAAEPIVLDDNYRSAASIVDLARLLEPDYRVTGQLPIKGEVVLTAADAPQSEAEKIVEYIQWLVNNGHNDVEGPIHYGRCAVLGRTRYTLLAAENAFEEANIPYYKRLSSLHVNESDLVEDFILGLRVLVNNQDSLHFRQLILRWNETPPPVSPAEDLFTYLRRISTDSEHYAVVDALEYLSSYEQPKLSFAINKLKDVAEASKDEPSQLAILQDLEVLSTEWEHYLRKSPGSSATLSGFLASMALGTTHQCQHEGVALLTVHSAKGLEFDVVFIVGLNEGVFPDYRAKTTEALDEERRNLFVAVTRSRRLLFLSYPTAREMPWGDVKSQRPSRFLRDLHLVP